MKEALIANGIILVAGLVVLFAAPFALHYMLVINNWLKSKRDIEAWRLECLQKQNNDLTRLLIHRFPKLVAESKTSDQPKSIPLAMQILRGVKPEPDHLTLRDGAF